MGDLTRGHTYAVNDTVNNTNIHALVDDATINASAVTTAKLNTGAVSADKLASDAVTTVKIAADAVTGAKIADDVIDSEHIVAGAIDLEHLSSAARPVTTTFGPASAHTTGSVGLVPAPSAGEQNEFLRGDGEWSSITATVDASVNALPAIAFHNHQSFI